jgi:hypothetical protein
MKHCLLHNEYFPNDAECGICWWEAFGRGQVKHGEKLGERQGEFEIIRGLKD